MDIIKIRANKYQPGFSNPINLSFNLFFSVEKNI